MDKATILDVLSKSALPEAARKRLGEADYADGAALDTAIQSELNYLKALAEVAAPAAQPVELAEIDVQSALNNSTLPQPSRARLAERKWKNQTELNAAITGEVAYLKEVTGSGRPVTVPAAQISNGQPKRLSETNKIVDHILENRFGTPARSAHQGAAGK